MHLNQKLFGVFSLRARRELYRAAGRSWPFEVYLILETAILAAAMSLVVSLALGSGSVWAVLILFGATFVHHARQLWLNPLRVVTFTIVGTVTSIFAAIFGAQEPMLWALLTACIFRLVEGEWMMRAETAART